MEGLISDNWLAKLRAMSRVAVQTQTREDLVKAVKDAVEIVQEGLAGIQNVEPQLGIEAFKIILAELLEYELQ